MKLKSTLLFVLLLFCSSLQLTAQSTPVIQIPDQQTNSGLLGNTQTVTRPSNVVAGNLIIVTLHYRVTNTSIINNDGLVLLGIETSGSDGNLRSTTAVFYKIATATEPATYTFTTTANGNLFSNWKATANRVTGHNPTIPIGGYGANNSGAFSISSLALPGITTTYDNSMLLSVVTNRDNVSGFSYPNSLVYQSNTATSALITSSTIPVAGPSGNPTFSWSPQMSSSGINIIINAVPCVSGNLFFNNLSCNSTNDGSIQVVNQTGGSGTYQYNINGGTWQSNPLFSNLTAGDYTVSIRDANNTACSFIIGTLPISTTVIANNDSYSAVQNVPLTMNVLSNDQCAYDPNTLSIVTPPSQGLLQIGANGQLIYLPIGSFTGPVQFVYEVCNTAMSSCAQATVTVNVEAILDNPCFESSKERLFYLPFPENTTQLRQSLISAANVNNLSANVRSIIGISIPYPGTIIHYDHWEDGYDADINNPSQPTTLIWGDGILTNGVAPGYPTDIIPAGGDIVLDNSFAWARPTSTIVFDGKDKLYSTSNIVISKATGDIAVVGSNTIFDIQNVKINVFDVTRFGQSFVIPFGEDVTLNGATVFNYTGLFVRAEENGTIVNLDLDGNSTIDVVSPTLNEGEVWFYNGNGSSPGQASDVNTSTDIKAGAIVTSNNNVGIDMLFGGIDAYGTRNIPIFPSEFYGNTYYSPVYSTSTSAPVVGYFVNPNPAPITINWTRSSGAPLSGSFVVAANQGISSFNMDVASGTKFQSAGGQVFTAVAVVDADANGSSYDWAFNMIPESRLTSFTSLAWAPGSSNGTANYNPVWVTPAANTTIYVKYDGNVTAGPNQSPCGGFYDVAYTVNALQSQLIFGLNNDNSGMAIYNCGEVPMSAVWGERPFGTTPVGTPALDAGYTLDPICFNQLIFVNDDQAITPQNTPITIPVLSNDAAFLAILNPQSVSNLGLLQPANGTLTFNSNGTITYTPNPGFTGVDVFEYRVCAQSPNQNLCDFATVTVTVPCAFSAAQNVITGTAYNDVNLNSSVDTGEAGVQGVVVNLYSDLNGNGVVDGADAIIQNATTGINGNYQFTLTQDYRYLDQFNTNGSATGSNGTINWTAPWTEIVESNGFNAGNVIVTNNRLRIAGNSATTQAGAQRTTGLSGATQAVLTYNFIKSSFSSTTTDWVDVQIATSPSGPWSTLVTYSGTAASSGAESIDISSWLSANTTIRIVESSNSAFISTEYVDFDNVQVQYYVNSNFVVALGSLPQAYTPTSPILPFFYAINFNGVNQGSCSKNFGVAQSDLAVTKTVNNANPAIGNVVQFTITVANNGTSNSSGVVVTDLLPTGLTYSTHSASIGTYTNSNGTWNIGQLAIGQTATLTVSATVTAAALPSVTNTAQITASSQGDPVLTNNSASAVVTPVNQIQAVNDVAGPINGLTGGLAGINVLSNDLMNGVILVPSSVTITSTPTGPLTVNSNGTVTVAPNTPAGIYTILYTICDVLVSNNCSSATVTVTVVAPVIDAVNDTGIPVNGFTGGTAVANVLVNDLLNGVQPTPAQVNTTFISSTNPGVTLSGTSVIVAPGTPSGTYTLTYQICQVINPSVCDQAVVTVSVTAPNIDAINDNGSAVNGMIGGTAFTNVLVNDLLNGVPVVPSQVTTTFVSSTNPGVTLSGTNVLVAPGTPAGNYTLTYQICQISNPSNCDQAVVTVPVSASTIIANDDYYGPVNGLLGGTFGPVFVNDLLNGVVPPLSLIIPTLLVPATPLYVGAPVPVFIPLTGMVIVPIGTPAGSYTIDYRICQLLNPTNCDPAKIFIDVSSAPIIANGDSGTANGATGATNILNVLGNDLLNNNPATTSNVTVTPVTTGPLSVTSTGAVNVAPNTPAGIYTIIYQICEILNTSNCDTAIVTVNVTSSPVVANDDDQSITPISGSTGFTDLFDVLPNDSLNGVPVSNTNIILSQLDQLGNFNVSPTGLFSMTNLELPGGIYEINYRICEALNPTNCDEATITVRVEDKQVNLKVLLQGALFGTTTGIMRDDLRVNNVIPLTNPYSSSGNPRFARPDSPASEVTTATLLSATGNDAIVDWIFIELRDPNNSNLVLKTKAALVQRDGDIVDANGSSKLDFGVLSQTSYFVSVKHRNHLGTMTAAPISFVNRELSFNFTTATSTDLWESNVYYEGYEVVLDDASGLKALWAGNVNADNRVKYVGTSNDQAIIFQQVINDSGNTTANYNYNFVTPVYHDGDVNLDAKVKYRGSGNDAIFIFFNVINKYAPLNTFLLYNYNLLVEQTPN